MYFLVKFLYNIDFCEKLYDNTHIKTYVKNKKAGVFLNYKNELEYFLNIAEGCKLKAIIVNNENIPFDLDYGIRHTEGLDDDYKKLFNKAIKESNSLIKINDNLQCNYYFIPLLGNTTVVVGPYITKAISNKDIEEHCASLSLLPTTIKNIQDYFINVPYFADDSFINSAVSALGRIIYGDDCKITFHSMNTDDIFDASIHIRKLQNDESEAPINIVQSIEKAYELENNLLNAISQGLTSKAEAVFGNVKPSAMLENRFTDKLRNAKNFMLVLNTLARKAVEQGGVHPIYIDGISSDFSLKIEAAPTVDECDKLFYDMIRKYSRLVQQHNQKNYSLLVQRVITVADTDITADLSLKNMAKILSVNPSYLSTHFKKETGVTLTEYVNKRRIERAKTLLKSTGMQIQGVAQSCGILDVNYFTKLFKKYTGVTPKEYKNS